MHGIVIFSWVSLKICSCKTTRTFPILFWLVITVSWSDKEKEDDMNVYFVHCRLCPGVGNFNLALLGWRIWPGNFKSFQRNKRILTFNMEVFKSEKITSRADGSVEMVHKKVPDTSHVFTTKMTIKSSAWVISPRGREFVQTNLHKFRWLEGCPKKRGGEVGSLNWSKHYYQINLNFLWFTVAINDRSGQPGCL